MKRQATEAQKQAAKERRERFRAVVKKVGAMPEADRLELASKLAGIATCEGHGLSLGNTMLLALQCPTATIVGGFRQWIKQGRAVRKGEHGHMIWVPSEYPRNAADDTPQPSDLDGEEKKTGIRFLIGTVFDIGQTCEIGTAESEVA